MWPTSPKERLRAEARELFPSFLDVFVAVAADFYGLGARTSVFNRLVIDALHRGRVGRWFFNVGLAHSMVHARHRQYIAEGARGARVC